MEETAESKTIQAWPRSLSAARRGAGCLCSWWLLGRLSGSRGGVERNERKQTGSTARSAAHSASAALDALWFFAHDEVEQDAVRGEEQVEGALQLVLLHLLVQRLRVQRLADRHFRCSACCC